MSLLIRSTFAALAFTGAVCAPLTATATALHDAALKVTTSASSQDFIQKSYNIKGNWSVIQEGGKTIIRFSDDFKTKKGPDLKVFLSPQTVADVTGRTALEGAVTLGVLKANKGTQDYIVPAGVSLIDFSSVLIHCEAYSVLWGGGRL